MKKLIFRTTLEMRNWLQAYAKRLNCSRSELILVALTRLKARGETAPNPAFVDSEGSPQTMSESISFRLVDEQHAWLEGYAKREGVPISEAIRRAIGKLHHCDECDEQEIVDVVAQMKAANRRLHVGLATFTIDAIIAKHCAIPDCEKTFVPSRRVQRRRRFCSEACWTRYKRMYDLLYRQHRVMKAPEKSLDWIREEALKRC